jgi:hypothetical protein
MNVRCEEGQRLFNARQKALDAVGAFGHGKLTTDQEPLEDNADAHMAASLMILVETPAIAYNGHVALCEICKATPPTTAA